MKKGLKIASFSVLCISFIVFMLPFHTYRTSSTGTDIITHYGMFFDTVSVYWAIPYFITVCVGIAIYILNFFKKINTELIALPILVFINSLIYIKISFELFQGVFVLFSLIFLILNMILLFLNLQQTNVFKKNYNLYSVLRIVLTLVFLGMSFDNLSYVFQDFDFDYVPGIIVTIATIGILVLMALRLKNRFIQDMAVSLVSSLYLTFFLTGVLSPFVCTILCSIILINICQLCSYVSKPVDEELS